jgi:hypothetical protein
MGYCRARAQTLWQPVIDWAGEIAAETTANRRGL